MLVFVVVLVALLAVVTFVNLVGQARQFDE